MAKPKASIILSTYNWPEALAMVLSALKLQSELNFEVLIADDGSTESTKQVIEEYKRTAFFPIEHLWQEDKGFRKSKILNRAILKAKSDILIFLDGDCIPHKHYVHYHSQLVDQVSYVAGRRVDLSQEFSQQLSPSLVESGCLNGSKPFYNFLLFLDSIKPNGSKYFHRSFVIKNPFLRNIFGFNEVDDMKGCNFSVLKQHMFAINGFDESFEGYGREDTDVELRLKKLNLSIKSAKNFCVQFHLWHEGRQFTPKNDDLLAKVKDSSNSKADKGIEQ